jgi:hypothetical protein
LHLNYPNYTWEDLEKIERVKIRPRGKGESISFQDYCHRFPYELATRILDGDLSDEIIPTRTDGYQILPSEDDERPPDYPGSFAIQPQLPTTLNEACSSPMLRARAREFLGWSDYVYRRFVKRLSHLGLTVNDIIVQVLLHSVASRGHSPSDGDTPAAEPGPVKKKRKAGEAPTDGKKGEQPKVQVEEVPTEGEKGETPKETAQKEANSAEQKIGYLMAAQETIYGDRMAALMRMAYLEVRHIDGCQVSFREDYNKAAKSSPMDGCCPNCNEPLYAKYTPWYHAREYTMSRVYGRLIYDTFHGSLLRCYLAAVMRIAMSVYERVAKEHGPGPIDWDEVGIDRREYARKPDDDLVAQINYLAQLPREERHAHKNPSARQCRFSVVEPMFEQFRARNPLDRMSGVCLFDIYVVSQRTSSNIYREIPILPDDPGDDILSVVRFSRRPRAEQSEWLRNFLDATRPYERRLPYLSMYKGGCEERFFQVVLNKYYCNDKWEHVDIADEDKIPRPTEWRDHLDRFNIHFQAIFRSRGMRYESDSM